MERMVLKSSDDQSFEVEEKFGRESKLIQHMVDSGVANSSTAISLSCVRGEFVAKIIEYFNLRHAVNADGDGNSSLKEALKKFDVEFVEGLDPETLVHLFLAVKCLGISKLYDLMVKKMCDTVKGKSPEEIRRVFNFVDDDTTPQEEARIRALISRIV